MKGQISLEYLLVFSISVSILLMVLPVVSEVEDVSREVVLKSSLDSLARDLSSSCEELLLSGEDEIQVTEVSFSVNIDIEGDRVVVSSGDVSSGWSWRDGCRVNGESFDSGDNLLVLRDLT